MRLSDWGLVFCAVLGGTACASHPSEAVRDTVLELPSWADTALGLHDRVPFGAAEHAAYVCAAAQLQGYDPEDLRAGIALAMRVPANRLLDPVPANVYVLLRILFDVPETIEGNDLKVGSAFAAFAPRPADGTYPLRWPVTLDEAGQVTEIAPFRMLHGGDAGPAAELDWFADAFGHRDLERACCGADTPCGAE